jgi:hypothetical protein
MSLMDHLGDSGSAVRAYLDGILPALRTRNGGTDGAHAAADELGLNELAASITAVPPSAGVDTARAGTAVDFRVRIALGEFDPHDSAAASGIHKLALHKDNAENGAHRARILTEAFDEAVQILDSDAGEADLDRAALVLAHCEQIHRSGVTVLDGSVGKACDLATDGRGFAAGLDAPSLADLRLMMESNSARIDLWRKQIAIGDRYEPNPVFVGSMLVGGADADWIIGDALIDSKAYAGLTVPKLRDFLRQLLAYVMLDLDDTLRIRTVGIWLPRQKLTKTWGLAALLGGDPEELLPALRQGFINATGGQQLGIHVPVTQQHRRQLLADNTNTRPWMLVDMALSNDAGIRFRIGRNERTPPETLRDLAGDRYAKVRVGVARNIGAPMDVLDVLTRDSSVVVRRAAEANPRTPAASKKSEKKATAHSPGISRGAIAPLSSNGVALPLSATGTNVQISKDRDDSGLETDWFREFLLLSSGGGRCGAGSRLPLPEASARWAQDSGRSTQVPEWLEASLPDLVKDDLMRRDRPAWVRRTVARDMPVSDPSVRDRLLADPDPEIRWSTLQRTVDAPDDSLGTLLGDLATSRKDRIRFRTEGDDPPHWAWSRSSAELDKETLQLVATHPSTPLSALQELTGTESADVLVRLVENPSLPAENLVALLPRIRAIRFSEPRERLAASKTIPSAAAMWLVQDRDARVRIALAQNEVAPAEALVSLAEDQDPSVRLAVIMNPNSPIRLAVAIAEPFLLSSAEEGLLEILRALTWRDDIELPEVLLEDALESLSKSRVRDPDMRQIVATDRRAGARTLERLAKSTDERVRSAVAGNPKTSSQTLTKLAADRADVVRAAAASNEAASPDLLATLAYDDELLVRASTAKNPNLRSALLRQMLFDDDMTVQKAAFENPSTSSSDLDHAKFVWERAYQAAAPSRADLEEMVANKRAEVRMQVALDRRTPPDFLKFLGGERRSVRVRRAVAANQNTPTAVLASLANDADAEVRQAVAFNGATSPRILAELAGKSTDLALLVAMNPDTSMVFMDALVENGDPLVSYVAAKVRASRAALSAGGTKSVQSLDATATIVLP